MHRQYFTWPVPHSCIILAPEYHNVTTVTIKNALIFCFFLGNMVCRNHCIISVLSYLPQKEIVYVCFSFSASSYSPSFPFQITCHSNQESCLAEHHSLTAFSLFPPEVNGKSYISKKAMFPQHPLRELI